MKISVCIATYNGENYIKDQLDSIFPQLNTEDEIIIVDDCSIDLTYSILESYNDSRLILFQNPINRGVNFSFEKAISLANGDFIFLSDQDDIWELGHVSELTAYLTNFGVSLVTCNFRLIDKYNQRLGDMKYPLKEKDSMRTFKNVLNIFKGTSYYYGCCMGFNKSLKSFILPFPKFLESHDLWISTCSNLLRSNFHYEKVLVNRRIHGLNVSVVNRNFIKKVISRIIFFMSLLVFFSRLIKNKLK
jgi:glycosyltransferase involved in cell wall biosynthesis